MAIVQAPRSSRGDIWLVDFDPAKGAEIRKVRPALVISIDAVGKLPLRIIVPITDWKPHYAGFPWFVELFADLANGLAKDSGVDCFQVKSVSVARLRRKLGVVTSAQMDAVASAIALCIGAPS